MKDDGSVEWRTWALFGAARRCGYKLSITGIATEYWYFLLDGKSPVSFRGTLEQCVDAAEALLGRPSMSDEQTIMQRKRDSVGRLTSAYLADLKSLCFNIRNQSADGPPWETEDAWKAAYETGEIVKAIKAERDELRAKLAEAEKERDLNAALLDGFSAGLMEAEKRIAELREYVAHKLDCQHFQWTTSGYLPCNCGLSDILKYEEAKP